MKAHSSFAALAMIAVTALSVSGCATQENAGYTAQQYSAPSRDLSTYTGNIDSIEVVRSNSGTSGGGAVAGGLVGGLLGNQVGGGNGRTAATVVGLVGGAMVGNQVERNGQQHHDVFQITVRLDNGGLRTIQQDSMNDLYVGNRVRIQDNRVYRD